MPRSTGAHYSANGYATTPAASVSAGVQYTASLYFQNNTGTNLGSKTIYFVCQKPGDDFSITKSVPLPTGTTRIDFTATTLSGTTGLYLLVDSFNATLGSGCDLTACLIETGSVLDTYFDGDTAGASWDGTAGNSTSTMAGGLSQALPMVTDASVCVALGRVKSRAIAVVTAGSTAIAPGKRKVRALSIAAGADVAYGLGALVTAGVGAPFVQATPAGRHVQTSPRGRG